jgi:cytochrome oxidase Cu insertion factor (SCO1/SenC/PrrC family)
MKPGLSVISILGVLAAVVIVSTCGPSGRSAREQIGLQAPDFSLADYEGNMVNLSGFKGKVTMLVFWFLT